MNPNSRFAQLDTERFEEFVSQHAYSVVVFLAFKEAKTELMLSEMIRLSAEAFSDVGFGFVVTSDLKNRSLCVQKEICITPLVKFFDSNGQAAEEQWVGYKQILESMTSKNLILQFQRMANAASVLA